MKKKVKVLHVLQSMDIGGIESYIMNMYRNIDLTKFSFDFLLWCKNESFYEKEIHRLGGNIYKINFSSNPIKNIKTFYKFFKSNTYNVIHCHTLFYCGFCALSNSLCNRDTTIFISHIHSKSDNKKNGIVRKIYKIISRHLILKHSTYLCACSREAGKYVFGKSKKFMVLSDYIDTKKYTTVNIENINKIKKKYKLDSNTLVIGNVGRLSIEKNQRFIIELMEILTKNKDIKVKCFFIGDGPEREELESTIKRKDLEKYFIFTGSVENVNEFMHCLDIFLFPSYYEGFGMALLEAQASGLFCLSSDNVPKTTDMGLNLVKYLPLANKTKWIKEIKNLKKPNIPKEKIQKNIIKNGFDVSDSIKKIEKMYIGEGYE